MLRFVTLYLMIEAQEMTEEALQDFVEHKMEYFLALGFIVTVTAGVILIHYVGNKKPN
jgi:hypothetical protein